MPIKDRLLTILTERGAAQAGASSDFDLNPGIMPPEGTIWRQAGVLVAVLPHPDGARLVLTKRSSQLKHHPGQVAFPGGKVEEADGTAEAAALREAREEVGLDPASVEVLGRLPAHKTVTGFEMVPVLGLIHGPFTPRPEVGEVAEVFEVPLAHVLNPAHYGVERRRWLGHWRHYYSVPWGPYYIWGATARVLRNMAG